MSDQRLAITMMGDRLLVSLKQEDGERKSRTGIVIPATAAVGKRLSWAQVMAAGSLVRHVQVGDKVLFDPEDRGEVELHGQEYVLLRERDIHAVAQPQDTAGSTGLYL